MHLGVLSIFSIVMWVTILFNVYKRSRGQEDMESFWLFLSVGVVTNTLLVLIYLTN
jgi:hypothetical protein